MTVPGVYSPSQAERVDATIRAAAESDGVIPDAVKVKVEAMARAMCELHEGLRLEALPVGGGSCLKSASGFGGGVMDYVDDFGDITPEHVAFILTELKRRNPDQDWRANSPCPDCGSMEHFEC